MPRESDTPSRHGGVLLVVGGRHDTVRKAAGLGLRVVVLQHKDHFSAATAALADAVILADYTDWPTVEPLVAAAHKVYGFTAAVSLTEPALEVAGRINDMFGLGGTSYATAHLLKDKLAMRRHLAAAGGVAAAASVPAEEIVSEESLRDFGARYGYPFVVKPADAAGSVGVQRVGEPGQVPRAWAAIVGLRARTDLRQQTFLTVGRHLAETYVEGPEYSVEAFSFDGRHVVVAVTEKLTEDGSFVELGHAEPARVDPGVEARMVRVTEALLDAVGLRDGASHTEVKLSPDGPVIIEGHNRVGGDRIVDLLELAYGVDFELLTVAWPFRLAEPLAGRPPAACAAATLFLTPPPGTVREVAGVEEVRAHPGVFAADVTVRAGDVVRAGSNWDRAGQIVVTAPDTGAALALCEDLAARIQITVSSSGQAGTEGEPA
jgi:biotin carboxylase